MRRLCSNGLKKKTRFLCRYGLRRLKRGFSLLLNRRCLGGQRASQPLCRQKTITTKIGPKRNGPRGEIAFGKLFFCGWRPKRAGMRRRPQKQCRWRLRQGRGSRPLPRLKSPENWLHRWRGENTLNNAHAALLPGGCDFNGPRAEITRRPRPKKPQKLDQRAPWARAENPREKALALKWPSG